MTSLRILGLTSLAMVAFASNSLLCRLALRQTTIDPATFTSVRIMSGALALWLMQMRREKGSVGGNWPSAFALFAYAGAFSFAYLDLSAATGALLLFGAVQATMIGWGLRKGERLDPPQWIGFSVAIAGLVFLLSPGVTAPPLRGSILMLTSGVAWGIYSLRGKAAENPIGTTEGNFLRAVPFAGLTSLLLLSQARIDSLGLIYGILSGALTSGLGYVVWYCALPGLNAASAATVQLSVPVLAAAGGMLLLGEPVTLRYAVAALAVLGGIALVVFEKQRRH